MPAFARLSLGAASSYSSAGPTNTLEPSTKQTDTVKNETTLSHSKMPADSTHVLTEDTPSIAASVDPQPFVRRSSTTSAAALAAASAAATPTVLDAEGKPLGGRDLEDYCRLRGLCPLCAKTKTRKRIFKLFKKNKWEPLTTVDANGQYEVYKGYCVKRNCFSLDQAKRLAGEGSSAMGNSTRRLSVRRPPGSGSGPNSGGGGTSTERRRSRRSSHSSLQNTSRESSPEAGASSGITTLFSSNGNNKAPQKSNLVKPTKSGAGISFPPAELKNLAFATTINNSRETSDDALKPLLIVQKSAEALLQDTNVVILDLSNIKLRLLDLQTLADALGTNTTLTSLILENCNVDDDGLRVIANGLFAAKDIPLTKLYMRTNAVGNSGVDALCQFLETNTTLEKLDLSRNSISTLGGVAIFNAFHRNRLSRIRCLNLSHNEILDLDENNFGVRALLAKNRTLRVLNLEGNFIHDEGAVSLANGIQTNESSALERLYLGWNGVGDDGTIALAKMLEGNTTMRVLGLGENEIKNAGARALLTAMDVNTTVREISGLWRNKIDRRFIIVAIRRLLLSHEDQRKSLGERRGSERSMRSERSARVGASGRGANFRSVDEQQRESTRQLAIQPDPLLSHRMPEPVLEEQQNESSEFQEQAPTSGAVGGLGNVGRIPDGEPSHRTDFNDDSRLLDDVDEDPLDNISPSIPEEPQGLGNRDLRLSPSSVRDTVPPPPTVPEDGILKSPLVDVHLAKPLKPIVMMESSTPFDRITVFQSSPLASFDKESSRHVAIPIHDYAHEADLIREALSKTIGAKIEVSFQPATIDGFSAFFREQHSRVVHLSCFGHPDYVDLENGFGSVAPLPESSLNQLMPLVGDKLQFVFVMSYHARKVGEAFVRAGVPHVVCCEREERYRDQLAGEFLQTFYGSLAKNKVLKQAFQSAVEGVRTSPLAKNARRVLDRFCLLPERPDNQYYHNAPVFFAGPVPQRPPPGESDLASDVALLPKVPQHFIGREVDMYEIIEALRVEDIVRVGGSPGSGKDSVVAAACHYVLARKQAFGLDAIYWLPPPEGVIPEEDTLYGDLCLAMRIMNSDTRGETWDNEENLECRERIELEREDLKTLLVIDDRGFKERTQREVLERFVSHLLNAGTGSKVLVLSSRGSDDFSAISGMSVSTSGTRSGEETTIDIGPLSFKSTALLFGGICKFITSSGCPAAHSAREFAELLEPPCVANQGGPNDKSSQRRNDLYRRMGCGLPSRVVSAASTMKKKQFIELIGIANRPEVHVDSLGQLDNEIQRLSGQKTKAIRELNFLRASNLEVVLEELEGMREEFPTLDDLRDQEKLMKKELTSAVSSRQYEVANELKKEILVLKKKIMKEQRTLPGQSSAQANGQIQDIKAHVESLINDPGEPSAEFKADVSFAVNCGGDRTCALVVSVGNLFEFSHPAAAMGIVCWTNESCELEGYPAGEMMIEYGGPQLQDDISQVPPIATSQWGPTRCGTGNAVIMGPETYGKLDAPCVILSVGPISPNNNDDVEKDDPDTLHYVISMLRSCYRSSLVLAKHAQLQTLGLSMLTTRPSGFAYEQTLRVGMQTLLEEVRFSHLKDLHIVTSSPEEASMLEKIARDLGLSAS